MSQVEYYGADKHSVVRVGRIPGDAEWEATGDDLLDYPVPRPEMFYDKTIAWLPHSCQEWIIGGPDEVRKMIVHLQAALIQMEKP